MFLPTRPAELEPLGWQALDVILISGDSYIDSPFNGVAIIGRILLQAGYRVGIIAQPEIDRGTDILRLGLPKLFWGISAGSVDSMVANTTATGKRRRQDDATPGGLNNRRPDRALIVYSNLIRRYARSSVPIVLGGLEASLRRVSHYDFWQNDLRRSVLFDARADILVYGMGEETVVALAECLRRQQDYHHLRGLCYISREKPSGYLELPSHAAVCADPEAFSTMFRQFYAETDPISGQGLCQRTDTRWLVQNPPALPLTSDALDRIYELDYTGQVHPQDRHQGQVRALDTITASLTTHRGCYGECNFCAITVHQGRIVQSRSPASLLREARRLSRQPGFKGILRDVGGPTANMYGFECSRKLTQGACRHRRCLFPKVCRHLNINHAPQQDVLKRLRQLEGVRRVFVASGIRPDVWAADPVHGPAWLAQLVQHHVSGQLKLAPEHCSPSVLNLMGKSNLDSLLRFKSEFDHLNRKEQRSQYLTYYFMAGHPGCDNRQMQTLKSFVRQHLNLHPRQVQIFTPTPSTFSSLMYYTGKDPFTGEKLFVVRGVRKRETQKRVLVSTP